MLLAINSGNTNCVFALFDGDGLRGVWKIATDHRRTSDEYAVWLTQLMALEGLWPKDVTAVTSLGHSPSSAMSWVSHTAYSSDVRRWSVAIFQTPRSPSPSKRAKTQLVLPELIARSIGTLPQAAARKTSPAAMRRRP